MKYAVVLRLEEGIETTLAMCSDRDVAEKYKKHLDNLKKQILKMSFSERDKIERCKSKYHLELISYEVLEVLEDDDILKNLGKQNY